MPTTRNPIFLLDLELDSGTERVSSREVNSPSYTWDPFVIQWGDIETSIPSPCGLPIISDAKIRLAESQSRKWRDLFSHQTPRRRKCTIWALFPGESYQYRQPDLSPPEERTPFFVGEIVDAVFNGDRSIDITIRDLTFAWLDEPIPAMITRDIYEGLDPRYEGQFLPIVCGYVRTPGIDDSPPTATLKGQIELPRMSETRWGVAATPVAGYRLFRLEELGIDEDTGESWVEVDPSEYVETIIPITAFNVDMNHTVIDFLVEMPDGTRIRADIDGIYSRGEWGPLEAVSTPGIPLRNPIDFFINMLYFVLAKAAATGDDATKFDMDAIAALREFFEAGYSASPPTPYYCDGAITRPITCREFLGQFLTSFNLDMWQKRDGKVSLNFTDAEDPDRDVYTETEDILALSFSERLPERHVNQIQYLFQRNYAEETWGTWGLLDTDDQEILALGGTPKIERDVVEFHFVRDEITGELVASKRAQFMALGSYRQEWEMALPRVPVTLEPSSLIGVTHRMGLEIGGYVNREVKTLSLVHRLGELITRVRGILREPQNVRKIWLSRTPTGSGLVCPTEDDDQPVIGEAFEYTFYVIGGSSPYSVESTGLPDGLEASITGNQITIDGTPTESGTFDWTVTVTDNVGRQVSASCQFVIEAGEELVDPKVFAITYQRTFMVLAATQDKVYHATALTLNPDEYSEWFEKALPPGEWTDFNFTERQPAFFLYEGGDRETRQIATFVIYDRDSLGQTKTEFQTGAVQDWVVQDYKTPEFTVKSRKIGSRVLTQYLFDSGGSGAIRDQHNVMQLDITDLDNVSRYFIDMMATYWPIPLNTNPNGWAFGDGSSLVFNSATDLTNEENEIYEELFDYVDIVDAEENVLTGKWRTVGNAEDSNRQVNYHTFFIVGNEDRVLRQGWVSNPDYPRNPWEEIACPLSDWQTCDLGPDPFTDDLGLWICAGVGDNTIMITREAGEDGFTAINPEGWTPVGPLYALSMANWRVSEEDEESKGTYLVLDQGTGKLLVGAVEGTEWGDGEIASWQIVNLPDGVTWTDIAGITDDASSDVNSQLGMIVGRSDEGDTVYLVSVNGVDWYAGDFTAPPGSTIP